MQTLETIRDYIRWGASQFTDAKLFHGHGTATAIDDAAALVLHSLYLPYDLADCYFGSKLTPVERVKINDFIKFSKRRARH
jgi:ribosomal protein L3 glutamine methyltransferase